MDTMVRQLAEQVQHNCDISDARFAGDYTLCTYLLKMREYFRWEKGYGFTDRLPPDEVGPWLTERERRWKGLEESDYRPLVVDGQAYPPFEAEPINAALRPHGLVYGGGIGAFGKPHFFLARLDQQAERDGYRILVSGPEHARDLTAPPAMLQHSTIFVRRESVRRMLWEKLEEWQWRRAETPMGRAARHYPFEQDPERALDAMTDAETEAIILHEEGERAAGAALGERWEQMLETVSRSKAEYLARAARDHLADSLTTLPTLIERRATASLHFYAANLAGLRREIFPRLTAVYQRWSESGDWGELEELLVTARPHWEATGRRLLEIFSEDPEAAPQRMEQAMPELCL